MATAFRLRRGRGRIFDPQTRTLDARIQLENPELRLRPGMFADAAMHVPVVAGPTSQPTTAEHAPLLAQAQDYQAALQLYLQAQSLLAQDKADKVPQLLQQAADQIQPVSYDPDLTAAYQKLRQAIDRMHHQPDIEPVRAAFKDVSAAMIELGKATALPPDAAPVRVFHCPMANADWLQTGDATANPYYGSSMINCGAAVEPLPKLNPNATPTTRPQLAVGDILAIPRSSVIDTGRQRIVYVESSPGVFDMRAVVLGAPAGDYYPVLSGLRAGEQVVTAGAFLIDAENRLNPNPSVSASATQPATTTSAGQQH
jgi:hypothetical protein